MGPRGGLDKSSSLFPSGFLLSLLSVSPVKQARQTGLLSKTLLPCLFFLLLVVPSGTFFQIRTLPLRGGSQCSLSYNKIVARKLAKPGLFHSDLVTSELPIIGCVSSRKGCFNLFSSRKVFLSLVRRALKFLWRGQGYSIIGSRRIKPPPDSVE